MDREADKQVCRKKWRKQENESKLAGKGRRISAGHKDKAVELLCFCITEEIKCKALSQRSPWKQGENNLNFLPSSSFKLTFCFTCVPVSMCLCIHSSVSPPAHFQTQIAV